MKILWTDEALDQLAGIEDFISKDSAERAVRFVDQIIAHTEKILSGNPRSGIIAPEISNPGIRELIYRTYRIVYRLNRKNIEILTVFEGHRLLRIDEIAL